MDDEMSNPTSAPVQVTFQPDGINVVAEVGEAWLAVAARAGVEIPTSCLQGSCGSCEVELESGEFNEVCRTCIGTVPAGMSEVTAYLLSDPSW
jgi:predicted molibdopterin-dependent oxidoreductase YjgC